MFGIQKLGRPRRQDQPHARAFPVLCSNHGADPFADFHRVPSQPAGYGGGVPDRGDPVAGFCH